MGCDGGTIPKRDELVRTKKKAEQKDKVSELNFLWQHCAITQTPLREPIVACGLGKLYNKDAVIMGILDKSAMTESAKHIKNLKDVKELNLTKNPAFKNAVRKGGSYQDHQNAPYICPLLGLEMNGKFKFCFYWSCGCVFSEKALKTLKPTACNTCQKSVDESSIVMLNATDEDLETNKTRMEERSNKLKLDKKAKKCEKLKIKEEPTEDEISQSNAGPSNAGCSSFKTTNGSGNIKIEDEKKPVITLKTNDDSKLKKIDGNGVKRPATEALGMRTTDYKKTKGDYSIASDPNASDVLKSLFTSSSGAKKQEKAHWITYNPFYN